MNAKAGRDVNITAATETEDALDFHKETTSGIMGSGMGIMLGTQTTKETTTNQNTTKAGSRVGSVAGNVNITAGNKAKVEAADIRAGKNINITGSEVDITASDETYNNQYKYEHDMTGLTISVGGGTISTIKENILDPLQRATEVTDKRLAALYASKAAINYGKNIKGTKDAAKNLTSKEALVGVSVSFGTSSSKQTSNTNITVAKGSNLNANGNVNITATGKDVNIHGSNVTGEDVTLNAKENVNITAAKNTSENISNTESSSMSLGVTMVHGIAPSFSASASMSQEKENTNGTSYTPSTVTANDKLTINSGKDTNIIGSQVKGDRVETTVGGDLNIESKQDTNTYKESSTSASIGLSSSGVSGGASAGEMNSDYASVTNQAGIYAGDKGFDINVKGNTDLKGAVIDSTATEDKNKLTTGTLSFSDIENKAEYSTSGLGFSYDSGATKDEHALLGDKGLIPNIPMSSSDDANSTTKSGVAPGTITITSKDKQKQDVSTLNRDTNNTLNKLGEIFDKETMKEKQELAGLFAELSFNAIHELSRDHKSSDPNKKKWSTEQIAFAHALVGLCAGELANSKGSPSVALSAGVNAFVVHSMMKDEKSREYYDKHQEELQWISAAVGSATAKIISANMLASTAVAVSGTRNNYLKDNVMPQEVRVVIFPQAIGTDDAIPHACLEFIYPGGEGNEELHFGPYVKSTINGPGVILDANSSIYVDSSLKTGRAYIYETIKDSSAINDIVAQANAFMKKADETRGNGSLRKEILNRYNDEDLDAYYSNNKYFGWYNAYNNNCLSFVKAVIGKHGKIKNADNFIFG